MSARRVVALLLVLLWAAVGVLLGGGVAYADEQASSEKTAQSDTKPAEKPAEKPDAKPEATEKPDAAGKADSDDGKPAKAPRGSRKHGTPKHATATAPTDDKTDKKPDPKPESTTAKAARTSATTADVSTVKVAAAATADTPKPATAAVAPSATASVPDPIKHAVQFARQMAGLANDVALLAVTLVNNIAAAAATAIGPKPLFGVPYHVATAIAGTAATAGKLLTGTPLNATSEGPFTVTYGVGDLLGYFNPFKVPAGANDPDITVTPEHPLPIILVAGTAANAPFNWSVGAPVLANAGYKVYTFNYGNVTGNPHWPVRGTADIRDSAQELADEVDRVLAANPTADKVILIGHSQGGGIMPAYYLNNLGGADKVSQYIGIAPSNHGADVDGLAYIQNIPVIGKPIVSLMNLLGPAWLQQAVGSPLLDEIWGDGDTSGDVLYTTISTTFDWIVTPYTHQALVGPNVTNIVLQDQYPGFNAGHLGIVFAEPTWNAVLQSLAANPAANPLAAPTLTAA